MQWGQEDLAVLLQKAVVDDESTEGDVVMLAGSPVEVPEMPLDQRCSERCRRNGSLADIGILLWKR